MKKKKTILLSFMIIAISCAFSFNISSADEAYRYVSPIEVVEYIELNEPLCLLDVQSKNEFEKHHIVGSTPTYAYPVATRPDKQKLDVAVDEIKDKKFPIVLICPRGGGAARRSYDYLKSVGIREERLFILWGGIEGWNYTRYFESAEEKNKTISSFDSWIISKR